MEQFNYNIKPFSSTDDWQNWKKIFQLMIVANGITNEERKKALLLFCGGEELRDIYYAHQPIEEQQDEPPLIVPQQGGGRGRAAPAAAVGGAVAAPAVDQPPDQASPYILAIQALDFFFTRRVNIPFERHVFRSLKQLENEKMDSFGLRLQKQAKRCQFANLEEEIRDQIIDKGDQKLKKRFLERANITLTEIMEIAHINEDLEEQTKIMCGTPNTSQLQINKVSHAYRNNNMDSNSAIGSGGCSRCGRNDHTARDGLRCPASGQSCRMCNRRGHFEIKCWMRSDYDNQRLQNFDNNNNHNNMNNIDRNHNNNRYNSGNKNNNYNDNSSSRGNFSQRFSNNNRRNLRGNINNRTPSRVHQMQLEGHETEETEEASRTEYAFAIDQGPKDYSDDCMQNCMVGGVRMKFMIDSGASCNVVDSDTWEYLKRNNICCVSEKTSTILKSYGNKIPLTVLGEFSCTVKTGEDECNAVFLVIRENGIPILGRKTATKLNILKIGASVNQLRMKSIGKMKNLQVHLYIDQKVPPVQQPYRRIPVALQAKVEKELENLQKDDIIEPASGYITWVSPLVIVPRGTNAIRLCVDMRRVNRAVIREHYPLPTIEDMTFKLAGAERFSKIDLKQAFHQLELDEESRAVTTFITHKGLWRFKRLMFGLSSAPQLFQKIMENILSGLDGVQNYIDDILVYGSKEQHDQRLPEVLRILKQHGFTLNDDKCIYNVSEVNFMGHLLSEKGIKPADSKVAAIKSFRTPATNEEVRSFLGLITYVGKFIPNLATITAPLRELLKSDVKYTWNIERQKAFDELKNVLSSHTILGHYNKNDATLLYADASPFGLGAVLIQTKNNHPRVISYASKGLSSAEMKYSHIEKEALSLVWAVERFHYYLYANSFSLITDAKSLTFLFSEKSKPCARIERWVLRLMSYEFDIKHISGTANIADVLSRLGIVGSEPTFDEDMEKIVYATLTHSIPTTMSISDVKEASDNEYLSLQEAIQQNVWAADLSKYAVFKDEFSVVDGIVLRGSKIIIPTKLRDRVLALAHEGHPGMQKMKQRIREKVWWPGIDKAVEEFVKRCTSCQLVGCANRPEPLGMTRIPQEAWLQIAADFLGPIPSGEYLLVVIDYYSRYKIVEVMQNTTAAAIIKVFDNIFTRFGRCAEIQTDNGQPFPSAEFEDYLRRLNIKHRFSTPYWPQQNGEVERQNRTILKTLKIARLEGKNWKDELNKYLYMYAATPHCTTGVSPAELMFHRRFRESFPEIKSTPVFIKEEVQDRDKQKKSQQKEYYDRHNLVKQSNISVGDTVHMKYPYKNKLSPAFSPIECKVIRKEGPRVTVQTDDGATYTRNSSHLKKIESSDDAEEEDKETTDSDGSSLSFRVNLEIGLGSFQTFLIIQI
jgi:hypothetical protein